MDSQTGGKGPAVFAPHRVNWTAEKVSRYWDFLANSKQGEFFSERHSQDLVAQAIRFKPRTLVDIGCGNGAFVVEAAANGIRAIGVDSSEEVLEHARALAAAQGHHVQFLSAPMSALPLGPQSVDAVTLFEVIEHLNDDDLAAALREARRVLSPRGVLIVTTPNAERLATSTVQCPDCGGQFHVMQHVRAWTPGSLRSFLIRNDFVVKSVRTRRFVENGNPIERAARRVYYGLSRQSPRLVAVAAPSGFP